MADSVKVPLSTALAFVLVTATACSGDAAEVPPPPEPLKTPLYSVVWSAEVGTDIFGRAAELIRATSEASELSTFTDTGNSYPGYFAALDTSRDAPNPEISRGFLSRMQFPQRPATDFRYLANLESDTQSVWATVCGYTVSQKAGENASMNPLREALRVELANPSSDPGMPGQADLDPFTASDARRTPTWNVFGDWTIEAITVLVDAEIPAECTEWWKERFPEFTPKPGVSDNVLFPPPGYVYPTAPVAAQYPEWIPQGAAD